MSPFQLAFHHLWRRKVSTFIALVGISVAIATAGILLRVQLLSQSRFASLARTGDAIVGAKSSDLSLLLGALNLEGEYPDFVPAVLYQSLAAHESVRFEDGSASQGSAIESIIPFVIFAKVQNFRVIATDRIFLEATYPTLPKLSEGRWPENQNEILVGSEAALKLGASLNQNLPGKIWIDKSESVSADLNLKVVGLLKATGKSWDRGLYGNLASAFAVFAQHPEAMRTPWRDKVLQYYLIYLRPGQMENLKSLVNQRTVAQTVAVQDEIKRLEELTGTQKTLALFITSIIVFLGALSVCTMMITRFESMGQQLAILRALGYSKRELTSLLFWEAALIGLCSVLLGALLDFIFFPWVRIMLGANLPSAEIVPMALWNSGPVWVTAFAGSLVSLLIPMLRLYRQNIHQSLRNIS